MSKKHKLSLSMKHKKLLMKLARRNKLITRKINEIDFDATPDYIYEWLVIAMSGSPHVWIWERCIVIHIIVHEIGTRNFTIGHFNMIKGSIPEDTMRKVLKDVVYKECI